MLDGLACRIAGHIWLQQIDTEPDGVKVCVRCGARDDTEARRLRWRQRRGLPKQRPVADIVPEDRPWLEPPFQPREF